ncbi:MAG: hypothetical protein Q9226_008777 [Calogaya cf. arnoldii]
MNNTLCYAPERDLNYEELFGAVHHSDNCRLEAALTLPINVNALQPHSTRAQAPLHIVAGSGNVKGIQLLLDAGADVNLRDSRGDVALHHAASASHKPAVEALLDAGAPVDSKSGVVEHTALFSLLQDKQLQDKQVIGWEEISIIKLFLDRGADVNGLLENYGTTLVSPTSTAILRSLVTLLQIGKAAKFGNLDLVKYLVERGATLPDDILDGVQDCSVAKYLLVRGAKIISKSEQEPDISAIVSAACAGNTRILLLLLSYANDTDIRASQHALHEAAYMGHVEVADILINHGFDVNTRSLGTIFEESALGSACKARKPNSRMVRKLLERDADVYFQDRGGSTALHIAAYSSDPETIRLLLDNGAKTSTQEINGNIPLIGAAHAMSQSSLDYPCDERALVMDAPFKSFGMILDATVDINVPGRDGYTALHVLACGSLGGPAVHGRLEAARLLVERGADLTIICNNSRTAVDIFVRNDVDGILREKASGSDPHRYCYAILLHNNEPKHPFQPVLLWWCAFLPIALKDAVPAQTLQDAAAVTNTKQQIRSSGAISASPLASGGRLRGKPGKKGSPKRAQGHTD